jgi:hypothetical protein
LWKKNAAIKKIQFVEIKENLVDKRKCSFCVYVMVFFCVQINKNHCKVWNDRPQEKLSKAFVLDIKYAGISVEDKLKNLRGILYCC